MLLAEFGRICVHAFYCVFMPWDWEIGLPYIYGCLIRLLAGAEHLYCGHNITAAVKYIPPLSHLKWLTNYNEYISCRGSNVAKALPLAVKIAKLVRHIYTPKRRCFFSSCHTYRIFISVTLLTPSFLIVHLVASVLISPKDRKQFVTPYRGCMTLQLMLSNLC